MTSVDDRFAALVGRSTSLGGWVPSDDFEDIDEADDVPAARQPRVTVLVLAAVIVVLLGVLAWLVFKPPPAAQPIATGAGKEPVIASAEAPGSGPADDSAQRDNGQAAGDGAGVDGAVVVHVTGQVATPGVVKLGSGARVADAIAACGGVTKRANSEAVNLARLLIDGEQIHVPAIGEEPRAESSGAPAESGTQPAKININTADAATLETLPGIGPRLAENIISHREQSPFTAVEDLAQVAGIGAKTVEKLRELITV